MGNSCSSGQAHKDKDNMSQRSEESGSYQVRASLPSEKQQTLLNHITPHSGVILEPTTAGKPQLPSGNTPTTTASALEHKPSLTKSFKGTTITSVSDSMSLSSPPGNQSPKDFDKLFDSNVPKEVSDLSENLQSLIMGKVAQTKTVLKSRKIVIYICAADSQDCNVEKGALHNTIYPELRANCRSRGYELHIVDLHWKTLLEKQQDHEFPELCIGELTRQMEVAYIIPVLFLNNSLGTQLLPITIETQDFNVAMESAENQSAQGLLSKWYMLDSHAQPPCYRLRPISCHIPGFKETSLQDREKAFAEWASEIDKMLAVLITVFSQELKDTYLTTVVEQEVHNTVFMSQELAKRCIWLNRIYTPTAKTPDNMSPGEAEAHRRLDILQKDLKNQLAEKHIVRIPVKYVEGGLNIQIPEHEEYLANVVHHLKKHLSEMINTIIEEHQSKTMLKPSFGIEATLFEELNQQTTFCQKAAQCSTDREKTINEVKGYINGNSTNPLVIYGPSGCGKTTLLARVAQCCQQWLPEAFLIVRFIGISAQSSTVEQLLSSITNQCSILNYGHKCHCTHNIETYQKVLPNLLTASCLQRPLIILLDGLDQVRAYSSKNIDWLPTVLPDNIKLIISVSEQSDMHAKISEKLNQDNFIQMPLLGETEAKGILMSSVMQYNHSVNSKIQDCVLKSVQECTIPLYSKVLAWQTSWWVDKEHEIVPKGHVNDQLHQMLEELETILGETQVQHALALLTCTKHSLTDSEMIDLLAFDEHFNTDTTFEKSSLCDVLVSWAPACITWSRINKYLAPFLHWTLTGKVLGIQWKDNLLKEAASERFKEHKNWAHQMLYDYYNGRWWNSKPTNLQARLVVQENILGKCYNRRRLDELPYQHFQLHSNLENSMFLSDTSWIYDKVCGSNCYQILEDINLHPQISNQFTLVLKDFIETHASVLNYDGKQFYSHMYKYLTDKISKNELSIENNDSSLSKVYSVCKSPPVLSLIAINEADSVESDQFLEKTTEEKNFDLVVRLPKTDQFIVTVSTNNKELCVWDIINCQPVRILQGVPHPINLIPIDEFKCIVLCMRELRTFDLNSGSFLTKLKGVMNQKMPYYGLHDQSHLVALSRNRMYINLMNLESGNCVTTFKAGEDRFLNSLLVSGDGRVLVCGDETQKPFPLLVWNLKSRKLLYDLRIPHHHFITALSAITYEGNYVCCVCFEIAEPNPNFIVVYDLQSGTLFKKWKPSCNTVSLEISSQGGCVISGLEDARILVWDLITGNCRWSLSGHTAPVSSLKLDPTGAFCLSRDSECRDRSIRIWDLNKGNLVAVYTPKTKISACEITSNGRFVVLALDGCKKLVTLELKGPGIGETPQSESYGEEENSGKTFVLPENC
uniref:NACHT and WD repeat domain-containing protein 2 isoform X1 n=1 Tax=Diabrotica virgifera virgifera TaxID=50390 RepID=A0A6P7FUD4_DIAVI